MQRAGDPAFGPVIARGQGSRVWDVEGREYFDLTCGYSAANFGHAFEPLVIKACAQLQQLTHVTGLPHLGRCDLAASLIRTCGARPDDKVIFNTSGSRAVETAWKAAVSFRPGRIVSIAPAYHGRSISTMCLSDTPRIAGLTELNETAVQRPMHEFAYCAHCPLKLSYPTCNIACQRSLLDWLEQHAAIISAVIVEPAVGARGYIVPPTEYWQRVREVTARHGILMIADEVQMGLGRAGGWLLSRMQGWEADLIVLGKSLGGGITPISAVIGRGAIIDALPPGTESETFAASPLATAVACEVLNQLAHGPWFSRAVHIGRTLGSMLTRCIVADEVSEPSVHIEICGASATLEFGHWSQDKAQAAAAARQFAESLVKAGLLIHYSGPYGTRVVMLPALTTSDEELNEVGRRCLAAWLDRSRD